MKKPVFKVGDTVFYPSAGVGLIERIEEIFVGGNWESCFVIHIPENHVTIKVPQSSAQKSGIRPLLSCRKLKELFKVLSAESGERNLGGNWTEHFRDLERRVNNGTCLELGAVVRDLMRLKKRNGLSFEEARLLETAFNFLAREVATVEGIPAETACARIRSHVETVVAASPIA